MSKLKAMKTVYCYLFPETWKIMKAVQDAVPMDMYRLKGRQVAVKGALSHLFDEYPLNSTYKDSEKVVDLDNHYNIMRRITEKYSEIIHLLEEFDWVSPGAGSSPLIFHLLAKFKNDGINNIHVLEGEYEGYGAYASHLGMKVHKWSYLDHYHSRDIGGIWFISNPSALDGNIIPPHHLKVFYEKLEYTDTHVVLDLSYAGSTCPHVYNVSHPNIKAVILSQSKPYGVFRFRMGGFLYSREEIPSLYGNKWFKDPLRMLQSLKLLEDLGFHKLYRKYRPMQEKIVANINEEHGIHMAMSDCLLLGHINPLTAQETLDPEHRALVEPYRRAGDLYRFCLTPYFENLTFEDWKSSYNL